MSQFEVYHPKPTRLYKKYLKFGTGTIYKGNANDSKKPVNMPSSAKVGVELLHVAVPLHLGLVAVDAPISLNKELLHTGA